MNAPVAPSVAPVLPAFIPDLHPYGVKPQHRPRTRDELIDAARGVLPILKKNAVQTNELQRPADESVEAIVRAGLTGLMRPKAYGGPGLELSEMLDVISVLAEGCANTAWVNIVYESHNWLMGMMTKEGQDDVFGTNDVVLSCGVFNPAGAKARAVDGGYMLSGRWSFGSGSTHSNFACLNAEIEGREHNGHPESRLMAVPRNMYQVLDTWHVRGLRGTGSHDIYIGDEIFVPERRTVDSEALVEGTGPGGKLHDVVAYRVPAIAGAHPMPAAVVLGATKAAVEVFKQSTLKRVRAFTGAKEFESPAAAARLGRARIEVEAAELLLRSVLREVEAEIRADRPVTIELRSKLRMATAYAPNLCKQAITSLLEGSAASSMGENAALSAALLDVTIATQHASLVYDSGPENYGRVLMGLEPSNPVI